MRKKDKLQQLKREIAQEISGETFVFPEYLGVKGFYGDGKVWFVGTNPSTSEFPDRHTELFYRTLREYGFSNAHLTDVSKRVGGTGDGMSAGAIERERPFFERELELLQPELLVTVGAGARTALDRLDLASSIERAHVRHYTWGAIWGSKDGIENDVARVAERAKEQGIHRTCWERKAPD